MTNLNITRYSVANPNGHRARLEALESVAKAMGLDLVGWGAVPDKEHTPEVTLTVPGWTEEDGWTAPFWVCPHCGEQQTKLMVMENGDQTLTAESADNYDYRIEESTPLEGSWSVGSESCDTETIAEQCPSCGGFVKTTNRWDWT